MVCSIVESSLFLMFLMWMTACCSARSAPKKKPKTMSQLADIWYGAQGCDYGRSHHYNDSRYHMLNLHATFTKGTLEFRLFQFDAPAEMTEEESDSMNEEENIRESAGQESAVGSPQTEAEQAKEETAGVAAGGSAEEGLPVSDFLNDLTTP